MNNEESLINYSVTTIQLLTFYSFLFFFFKTKIGTISGNQKQNSKWFLIYFWVVFQFWKDKGVHKEFTRNSTPQENKYFKAFHSYIQRESDGCFEFESIYLAQMI